MTYLATLKHMNTWPGVHEIYNYGRPFLGHLYNILSLSDLCPGVEKKTLKNYINFTLFTQKLCPIEWGLYLQFLFPYPTYATYQR